MLSMADKSILKTNNGITVGKCRLNEEVQLSKFLQISGQNDLYHYLVALLLLLLTVIFVDYPQKVTATFFLE